MPDGRQGLLLKGTGSGAWLTMALFLMKSPRLRNGARRGAKLQQVARPLVGYYNCLKGNPLRSQWGSATGGEFLEGPTTRRPDDRGHGKSDLDPVRSRPLDSLDRPR